MQGPGQGGGPPGGGPRTMQISLNRDVKLKTSENAWKPTSKDTEGEDDETKTVRLLKGILNKLTPNNINKMIVEIKKLQLNKISILRKMITTLFDKAVDEPMYADQYATLCVTMAKTEVRDETCCVLCPVPTPRASETLSCRSQFLQHFELV